MQLYDKYILKSNTITQVGMRIKEKIKFRVIFFSQRRHKDNTGHYDQMIIYTGQEIVHLFLIACCLYGILMLIQIDSNVRRNASLTFYVVTNTKYIIEQATTKLYMKYANFLPVFLRYLAIKRYVISKRACFAPLPYFKQTNLNGFTNLNNDETL